jgi:hypothetical protein
MWLRMVKKMKLILMCFMCLIGMVGCQLQRDATPKLVYEELSKREEYLLNLTGSKVLIYNLDDLPNNKNYEIELVYEVYEDGKKIKEEPIIALINDHTSEKILTKTIALNIQEDKIRYLLGSENGYASGKYDLEEELSKYSMAWLPDDIELNLGTEVYLCHAHSGNSTASTVTLGVPIDTNQLNKALHNNQTNIFIKLSFKEI